VRAPTRAAVAVGALLLWGAAAATGAQAQPSASGGSLPSGTNLLNPAISAIGWFQAQGGDVLDQVGTSAFALREAEIGLQANVDPYSRADFFLSVSPEEGIDLEEGTVTFLALPAGLTAKLGKFRGNFGKFNRTHPPETPFADRPLVAERFLGEEGLSAEGVSASWLLPGLPFYANFDAEITNTPDLEGATAFAPHRGKDLLYLARLSAYFDLSEATNVTIGSSYANGANGAAADSLSLPPDPGALRASLIGADLTVRWKNPRRAIYRSLIAQLEWMQRRADLTAGPEITRSGGYAWVDLQFARRWHVGGRYDWSDALDPTEPERATGGLGFLTFVPSEFASLSGQLRRQTLGNGDTDTVFYLKTTFNIGPHGQHPF